MIHDLTEIIVPIGVCVVLPVLIVWIITRARINYDNKRTAVLMEAIRHNDGLDAEKIAEALRKPGSSERDRQHARLLRGCLYSLIGLVFIVAAVINGILENWMSEGFGVFGVIGGVSLAIGVAYLIVYRVASKTTSDNDSMTE